MKTSKHIKDAHNGRPIYVQANLSEGQIVPFWSVRIGESEEAQDVGVFKMRCMDMRCDDERKWATQCAEWMNSHNTFGGDISPDMAYNALLAVFKAFGGRRNFWLYYSDRRVDKREELDMPVYEAECLIAELKWAEGAAILQKEV